MRGGGEVTCWSMCVVVHSACVYNTWVNGSRQQLQLPRCSTLRMLMWTHSRWEFSLIHCGCVYLGYTTSARVPADSSLLCVYIIYSIYLCGLLVALTVLSAKVQQLSAALFWPGVFFPPTTPSLFPVLELLVEVLPAPPSTAAAATLQHYASQN